MATQRASRNQPKHFLHWVAIPLCLLGVSLFSLTESIAVARGQAPLEVAQEIVPSLDPTPPAEVMPFETTLPLENTTTLEAPAPLEWSQPSFDPLPKTQWQAGYDNGIFIRGTKNRESFEMKANMRIQFRFVAFSRDTDSWTNSAGMTFPVLDRQYFDLERSRLIFSGHAFSPSLTYFAQFDSDTDSAHVTSLLDGWFGWKVNDERTFQFGKRKVPGTRMWLLGAFDTRMVDRAMSNEFFRPSRTTGIWLIGDPDTATHYELMIGQGYNTEGLTPDEMGNNFALSGSIYRDVIGNYGPLRPTDFEYHEDLAVRVGMSSVGSIEGTPGRELEETDFLRLTDGTRITDFGALAPGARVQSFDVFLFATDAAFKYRGWSANSEAFVRSITNLNANLPVPAIGLQYGFYCEGGTFLIPKRFEWNSQYSFVTGDQGSANSYTTGVSYYPKSALYFKFSVDGTYLDGSPTNSTGADILVGDKGFLLRTQWQATF